MNFCCNGITPVFEFCTHIKSKYNEDDMDSAHNVISMPNMDIYETRSGIEVESWRIELRYFNCTTLFPEGQKKVSVMC